MGVGSEELVVSLNAGARIARPQVVDSTLSWLYRSQYVALVAPTSCFGVAVMSESEYMQKVPQDKLLLVIRATFFPKSAKQPNVLLVRLVADHGAWTCDLCRLKL